MVVDWVIIGGGIHGVHLAARLIDEAGVAPEDIRIVDEHSRLLERWRTCTSTTGMTHLRSPAVHHLDPNPWSLLEFAGKKKSRKPGLFAPPYNRPSLELFNAHCDRLIERLGLEDVHIQARAIRCAVECDSVQVELSNGEKLVTRQVVLAMGNSEQTDSRNGFQKRTLGFNTSSSPIRIVRNGREKPTQWSGVESPLVRWRSDCSRRDTGSIWYRAMPFENTSSTVTPDGWGPSIWRVSNGSRIGPEGAR